ncbi:MAG: hypothetical protein AB1632_05100 [Nitrospirota bacterium]
MVKTKISILMLLALSFLLMIVSGAFAAGTVKAIGNLISVEEDGTVVIEENGVEKGYLVSSSAEILDSKGRRTSVSIFPLPSRVSFEYKYTKKGFEITFLQEIVQ